MCLSALYTKIADTISSASFRGGCEIRTHGTLVTFSGFPSSIYYSDYVLTMRFLV